MKKYFILLVSILFVGINPFTINTQVVLASLVEYGLIASDDELLTLDTDTGLEWLDLTATQNQSYNSVINGYGGYTTIHNFRVANASEINTLFQNVGIPDQWSDNAANIPGATDLFLFLGILREIGCNSLYPQYQSHGMSVPWQPCCPNSPKVSTFFLTYENQTPVSGRAYLDNGGTNMTSSFKYRGVFLVRDAASPFEPSSNQPSNLPPPCVAPPEPTITVTSPNGGEELSVGEVYEITWTSEGEIDFVKIEYSVNNGLDWTEIVANTDNEGSYDWIVPSDISNQSQVRISDVEGEASDVSNGVFSIMMKQSTQCSDFAGNWSGSWSETNCDGFNYSGTWTSQVYSDCSVIGTSSEWITVTGTIDPSTGIFTGTGTSENCGSITLDGDFIEDSVTGSYIYSSGGGGSFIGSFQSTFDGGDGGGGGASGG